MRKAVGADASRYATQQVRDSLMQFNSNINVAIGKEAGATHWKYSGSLFDDSREHCRKHEGKIYTEEEINEIWSGSWKGKAEGNPFCSWRLQLRSSVATSIRCAGRAKGRR